MTVHVIQGLNKNLADSWFYIFCAFFFLTNSLIVLALPCVINRERKLYRCSVTNTPEGRIPLYIKSVENCLSL